jgi:subtilisin
MTATSRTPRDSPRLTWSLLGREPEDLAVTATGPPRGEDPGWRDARGAGVRVCVVDSGVEDGHPRVGPVQGSWAVAGEKDAPRVVPVPAGDVCGHGTACAGIVRRVAPDCELHSVRVLDERSAGSGDALLTGLEWAVDQGFDVINLSLSTTRVKFLERLRELADRAYFSGTVLVASAHNAPVESYPWRFSSVLSVGSHRHDDPDLYLYNPTPPVEFFAHGQNVEVAWPGGGTIRTTGNSFATPYVTGLCARALAAWPGMTPFQLKDALYRGAANVHEPPAPGPRGAGGHRVPSRGGVR